MSRRSKAKFNLYTQDLADSIELMFVAAIRKGIEKGFEATLNHTVNSATGSSKDSGNATYHWTVGVEGIGSPTGRKKGKLEDLRETSEGKKHPLIGKRRDQIGKNDALVKVLVQNVLDEELKKTINKYIVGQRPPLKYYFYNPVGRASADGYDDNAKIAEAGNLGISTALAFFEAEIAKGNIRRHRRR